MIGEIRFGFAEGTEIFFGSSGEISVGGCAGNSAGSGFADALLREENS